MAQSGGGVKPKWENDHKNYMTRYFTLEVMTNPNPNFHLFKDPKVIAKEAPSGWLTRRREDKAAAKHAKTFASIQT